MRITIERVVGLAIFVVIGMVACKPDNPKDKGSFVWKAATFEKASPSCATDSNRCATIKAIYPIAMGGSEAARRRLNENFEKNLRRSLAIFSVEENEVPATLDSIAASFLHEYELAQVDYPDGGMPWMVETISKILYDSPKFVTIEMDNYSYAGGAHPNYYVSLLNFDATTGEPLKITDLITDTLQLAKLAEAKFREVRELGQDENLNEAGFFWGETFILPENFGIKGDSLYLFYNPYEIAPYALGPTDFSLPFDQLKGILRKEKIVD